MTDAAATLLPPALPEEAEDEIAGLSLRGLWRALISSGTGRAASADVYRHVPDFRICPADVSPRFRSGPLE